MINYFGNYNSNNILIQMIGEHETSNLESEFKHISKLSPSEDFCLIAIKVDDWNDELSPWKAPAAFGNGEFGGKADETFKKLVNTINSEILQGRKASEVNIYLGGYSLSGLFALWCAYQTDIFRGVAAVSASVWFPKFYDYISENDIHTQSVYLSLGKKEEKTRNPLMSSVGKVMRDTYYLLSNKVHSTLEWNEGNHFCEPDLRMAKGFSWLLNNKEHSITVFRAKEEWQRAGAYSVRIQGMNRQYHISLRDEFDEHDCDGTKYIVLLDDGYPVATCRFYEINSTSVVLGRLVVLPEYRGRKLGLKVLNEAESWIKELGYKEIIIDSRVEAIGFYEKAGYLHVDDTVIKSGDFDCIRMNKIL